jgi:hypothetical protein
VVPRHNQRGKEMGRHAAAGLGALVALGAGKRRGLAGAVLFLNAIIS